MGFTEVEMEIFKDEIDEAAAYRQARAALGSIMRRNWKTLAGLDAYEKIQFLRSLGQPVSYTTEIAKEVALQRYEEGRG